MTRTPQDGSREGPAVRVEPFVLEARAPEAPKAPAWAKPADAAFTPWSPPEIATLIAPATAQSTRPPEPAAPRAPVRAAVDELLDEDEEEPKVDPLIAVRSVSLPPSSVLMSTQELTAHDDALIARLREPYMAAARRLNEAAIELQQRLHEDLVELSARIASALVMREVHLDRSIVLSVARRALRLAAPLEHCTLKCNSADADHLRAHIDAIAESELGRAVEVVVRPSDDITQGGLILTFEGGVVDARNERRLARIVSAVKAAMAELSDHDGRLTPEEPQV